MVKKDVMVRVIQAQPDHVKSIHNLGNMVESGRQTAALLTWFTS